MGLDGRFGCEIVHEREETKQSILIFGVVEDFFAPKAQNLLLLVSGGFIQLLQIVYAELLWLTPYQLLVEPRLEHHRGVRDSQTHWTPFFSFDDGLVDYFFRCF